MPSLGKTTIECSIPNDFDEQRHMIFIAKLYHEYFHEPTSHFFKLHAKLDAIVLQAYGFKPNDDLLEKLLAFNLELAEKEKQGEPVVDPWAP